MKMKLVAILMVLALILTFAACGGGEETTLTGMVVSVDGTVISLMEMDGQMSGMNFGGGERPEMPEGMEGFEGFGSFNPEDFDGTLPEDGDFSQWGNGEMPQMPEGMEGFEGFGSFNPEDFEGMTPPEGMTAPEDGQMPDFGGMDFGELDTDAETKTVDIGDAHISVEIDGGKASGSMDDIKAGAFVTITMNGKGQVTNVLVSSTSGFGGGRGTRN